MVADAGAPPIGQCVSATLVVLRRTRARHCRVCSQSVPRFRGVTPAKGRQAVFVTVIHRIHDPEGFETAEAKALEAGLPSYVALPIHAATEDHILGICIWEGESVDAVREVVEGAVDHGRTTSTTRCTWTDLRRSSESNRLIATTPIWVIWKKIPSARSGLCDRVIGRHA